MMIPSSFEYVVPKSLREATRLLKEHGEDAKVLAGGHSLVPLMKLRLAQPRWLIDLRLLDDLKKITKEKDSLRIGALCTHRMLEASPVVGRSAPLLRETAAQIGDPQVRNRGTIGGSLAHSDPAADYPPSLLVLDGSVKVNAPGKSRKIKGSNLFVDFYTTSLQPDEILSEVIVPIQAKCGTAYVKLPDPASGFAVVGAAALVKVKNGRFNDVRLAFTGVASHAFRARTVEKALLGESAGKAAIAAASNHSLEGVEVLGDAQISQDYRSHLAALYAQKALQLALERAG